MSNSNIKNNLLKLGFSLHDAEIYLALVKKGPCTAGPIISETKLHRNVVYTSLDHLVGKKLISEKIKNGRKFFSVISPDTLVEDYSQKADLAKKVAQELERLVSSGVQEITIHQGNEEYLSLLTSIIKSMSKGNVKYVLGTGGEDFMKYTMRPIWKKYHEAARAQNIKIKMLGYESQRSAVEPDVKKEKIYEVKYLPANIENPAGIHIYPEVNTVLNIMYSDENTPVTAIKIKNKALVQGYLNLFHNLWKMARK